MLNHLKSEANIAYTENGAVTNASTMSDCLDLFAGIGALRAADDQEIIRRFVRSYAEDADIAMKILFFGRDVRGGLGERRVFRVIINWLAENRAESLRKNIEFIPEFGRYDDLVSLIGTACEKDALRAIRKQLEADLASDAEVSLLAKWLPSVNASNAETVRKAKRIARYQQNNYTGEVPTLQDFRAELLKQSEPEAQEIALAIELFTNGSLNTFAKKTNVNTDNRLICYDILDLGKQLMPIGMLVVLDSILNRITQNRAKGKNTFVFIDEIYLLFQHEYSANFLFTLWKRVRKYGAYATGITQNVDDLLQSHTARTMLANSEFIVMLNQASTDRLELAKLLNISDTQLSYITNVDAGHGLIKVGSSLVPFANKFPKHTKLYKLMTTKPGEGA